MSIYQPSIFDEAVGLAELSKPRTPLEHLTRFIDFQEFRPRLETIVELDEVGASGRRTCDAVLSSNPEPATAIQSTGRTGGVSDHRSVVVYPFSRSQARQQNPRFVDGVAFSESAKPSAGAVNRFVRSVYQAVGAKRSDQKEWADRGREVVKVARQRNSRDENQQAKASAVPVDWKDRPTKLDSETFWNSGRVIHRRRKYLLFGP